MKAKRLCIILIAASLGLNLTAFQPAQAGLEPAKSGLAAAISVSSAADVLNGSDGVCTLREAIIAANTNTASGPAAGECPAGSGADTIILPAGEYTFQIDNIGQENASANGDLDITADLTLTGAGTACAVAGPRCSKVDGNHLDRVFHVVGSETDVLISQLAIYSGNEGSAWNGGGINNEGALTLDQVILIGNSSVSIGGGFYNSGSAVLKHVGFGPNSANLGGGIGNAGTLTLEEVSVTMGNAGSQGGCLYNNGTATLSGISFSSCTADAHGGAVWNGGLFILENGTINTNQAGVGSAGNGGGIYNTGRVELTNVTLNGNSADLGGGIYSSGASQSHQSTAILLNATISSNTDTGGTGGIYSSPTWSTFTLKNTILAFNQTKNCTGPFGSQGHNIDSGSTCALALPGDRSNTDPLLAPLANDGAFLDTQALLPGSPAIDAGDNTGCPLTDARGLRRPKDGNGDGVSTCDIGAYEAGYEVFIPLVLK